MTNCPYIEITDTNRRAATWKPRTATLCALPEEHGGLHVMQSGREYRKWAVLVPVAISRSDEQKLKAWLA